MARHLPSGDDLQLMIDATLGGNSAYEAYLYDDLPRLRPFPLEWEPIIIAASRRGEAASDHSFLWFCVSTLMGMGSEWDGVEGLLVSILKLAPGYLTFDRVARYALTKGGRLGPNLCRSVVEAHDVCGLLQRSAIWLDSRTRKLIRSCTRASEGNFNGERLD